MANLYASVAAGVAPCGGPLHGGANVAVMEMLTQLKDRASTSTRSRTRQDKDAHERSWASGHRVYKNFDPRAKIIKEACHALLQKLGVQRRRSANRERSQISLPTDRS